MSPDLLALAEPLLVFGLLVVFMHWQFRELRQRAAAREEAARQEAAARETTADTQGRSDEAARHPEG